jgi:hypothetical protein
MMNKKIFTPILTVCAILLSIGIAHADETLSPIPNISDQWRFEVTPYAWLPTIGSTLSYNDRYVTTASLDANKVLSSLKSGAMIAGEAHYGNWGVMGDFITATLQKSGTIPITIPPGSPATLADKGTVQSTILTGAATYTLFRNQNAYVDGLVGARWVGITATLNLALNGTADKLSDSSAMSTVDPIVGFKGRYRIADSSWYIPIYGDIGGGGGTTNMTWQGILGVGKTFEKWLDVSLVYRGLYYDMRGGSNNGLLQKTTFQGPQLSATFNF